MTDPADRPPLRVPDPRAGAVTGFVGPDRAALPACRVVVVDDLELARRRTVVALEADDGVDVVAEAAGREAGLARVAAEAPDVTVVALALDDEPDPGVVTAVRGAWPGGRVVVVTTAEDDHLLGSVLAAGAHGIVTREGPAGAALEAVRTVAAGGAALTPVAAGALLDRLGGRSGAPEGVRRPLSLLATGVDPASVAEDVGQAPDRLAALLAEAVAALGG